jgi:hypothetical protein
VMKRPSEFETEDIDLAAAIVTATGRVPGICQKVREELVTFIFHDDETVRTVIVAYAGGGLTQPVKRFAACRSWLYRKAKGFGRGRT